MTRLSAWFSLLFAALAVFTLPFENLLPFAAGIGALFSILLWLRPAGSPLPRLLFLGLALLLALLPVTLSVTPLPAVTHEQALRLLVGMELCLCLGAGLRSRRALAWALAGFLAAGIGLASAGLLFTRWEDKFSFLPALPTLLSIQTTGLDTDINANVMGGILALFLAGLSGWWLFRWSALNWPSRLGLVLASALIGGVLVLTQARTALLALAAALLLLVSLRWRRGWIMVAASMAAGLLLLNLIGSQRIIDSLTVQTGSAGSIASRERLWLRARLLIADFPLTGVGMGTFNEVLNTLYPLATQSSRSPHAHNLFLQITADLGLPGLLAWLLAWFSVLWMAFRLYRRGDPFNRALGAAILCSQAALFVHGLLDCVTWGTRPAILVWAIWGLTAAAYTLLHNPEGKPIVPHLGPS